MSRGALLFVAAVRDVKVWRQYRAGGTWDGITSFEGSIRCYNPALSNAMGISTGPQSKYGRSP